MRRSLAVLALALATTVSAQQIRTDGAEREGATFNVLIPIAGDVAGANGTHFQTDVTLANRSPFPAHVGVFWLPQGRSGSVTTPIAELDLAANTTRFFPAFVTDVLHQTGLGAFFVRALKPDGTTNFDALIDVYARIWTPSPNGAPGTFSQGIYGASLRGPGVDDFQPVDGWIYGLRQNADFRTNYGIVNLENAPRTFDIIADGDNGAHFTRTVTLPAASMIHDPLPQGQNFGQVTIRISIHQEIPPTFDLRWCGFGSTVDNRTGDAWYSKVQGTYLH
ncbi:MAG TPA: hypothetical protein VJZ00_22600 [Thermoanaerobaculia bacterium]|nr:hypothetical protein [Thermoanaerobaculia bacterium]